MRTTMRITSLLSLGVIASMPPVWRPAERRVTSSLAAPDSIVILSADSSSTSAHLLVTGASTGVRLAAQPLDRRGDTLIVATPATLVFEKQPLGVRVSALAPDAFVRLAMKVGSYDCIIEGRTIGIKRPSPTAALKVESGLRDMRSHCNRTSR